MISKLKNIQESRTESSILSRRGGKELLKKLLKKLKKTCRKPVDKVRKEWYY